MIYLLLIIGFVLLIKGADIFLVGSSNIAKSFGIPSIVIGLTLVSLGTSLPELAVSLVADINNSSDLSISNIIGSNLFNLFVVLGICSLFKCIETDNSINKDYKVSVISIMLLLVIVLIYSFIVNKYMIGRLGGFILVLSLIVYIIKMIRNVKYSNDLIRYKISIYDVIDIVGGIILIIVGGNLTVSNAIKVAYRWGFSERFIGLTIVAMGTSLPELCTSLIAIIKNEKDIALGNILGSNIINVLLIIGVSSIVSPLFINMESIIDIILLIIGTIFVFIVLLRDYRLCRRDGLIMLGIYLIYFIYIYFR